MSMTPALNAGRMVVMLSPLPASSYMPDINMGPDGRGEMAGLVDPSLRTSNPSVIMKYSSSLTLPLYYDVPEE